MRSFRWTLLPLARACPARADAPTAGRAAAGGASAVGGPAGAVHLAGARHETPFTDPSQTTLRSLETREIPHARDVAVPLRVEKSAVARLLLQPARR